MTPTTSQEQPLTVSGQANRTREELNVTWRAATRESARSVVRHRHSSVDRIDLVITDPEFSAVDIAPQRGHAPLVPGEAELAGSATNSGQRVDELALIAK